jgi:hypothetical protein
MSTPSSNPAGVAAPVTKVTSNEEDLRAELRSVMLKLRKREPLDTTYKRLLMNGVVTLRRPVLPKGRIYKRVGTRLRERVENYIEQNRGKDLYDRISQRQPLEEDKMRAALTLREAKDHEQQALLEATLSSLPRRNGMDEMSRRRHMEGIAMGLQNRGKVPPRAFTPVPTTAAEQIEAARQQAELEQKREQARAQEETRRKREDDDRRQREEEIEQRRNTVETPQQALRRIYYPIFKKLWDMDFPHLGGINPFRIVIDRENCASVGAPDYFDVIETPMNLSYIQQKVDSLTYENLGGFFSDVELMLKNALKYNSDPSNPYRIAAEEMRKRYLKMAKKVMAVLKQNQRRQPS